jgi:hypothetical protein
LIVFGEPWNLSESDLHSFLSLASPLNIPQDFAIRSTSTHLSKIFFTCTLRFFSSALLEDAVGADALDVDATALADVLAAVLARFAGGGVASSSSS